jgi:8-oxo-dGTP diphosphatase
MHLPARIRVAGLILHADRVLLIRHEKEGRGYWLLPGGGVEPGETLEDALLRELAEECRLDDVALSGPIALAESIAPPTIPMGRHVVHLVYEATVDPRALETVTSNDASVRNHRLVSRREVADLDLRPPIQRFVERYQHGDPFIALGRVWVS